MISQHRRFLALTGLLLLAGLVLSACSGGGSSSSGATDVTVTLTDFQINSTLTNFQQGVKYHFTVINNGAVAHQLYIMPPTSEQLTDAQVQQMALAGLSETELTPGSTKTFDYTFTKAYPSGSLEFACHVPGHYDAGMHLGIVVQ
jgi:uncharacterized cupredoxin-like copper-binding protein